MRVWGNPMLLEIEIWLKMEMKREYSDSKPLEMIYNLKLINHLLILLYYNNNLELREGT